MRSMQKSLAAAGVATALMFAANANALPIKTALAIVIDGSGSISAPNFEIQRSAYQTLLGNSSILPADGSVVVNVVQFDDGTLVEQTAIRIVDEAARAVLTTAFDVGNFTQLGGLTAIGDGITTAYGNMDSFLAGIASTEFAVDFEKLIDVSTDGANNSGLNPTTATQNALNAGYSAVNCLGIGASANCGWNLAGLDFSADSFAELEAVLELKLRQEIGTVPVPGTVALLGLGLAAFGFVRRRAA